MGDPVPVQVPDEVKKALYARAVADASDIMTDEKKSIRARLKDLRKVELDALKDVDALAGQALDDRYKAAAAKKPNFDAQGVNARSVPEIMELMSRQVHQEADKVLIVVYTAKSELKEGHKADEQLREMHILQDNFIDRLIKAAANKDTTQDVKDAYDRDAKILSDENALRDRIDHQKEQEQKKIKQQEAPKDKSLADALRGAMGAQAVEPSAPELGYLPSPPEFARATGGQDAPKPFQGKKQAGSIAA